MASITTIGDMSMGPSLYPIILLIGFKTGYVTACRNLTIGLYGSGLTQLINAEIITIHIYILSILDIAIKKIAHIDIYSFPNSFDLFAAASITAATISLSPFSSNTLRPAAVVPPGDVTISLSLSGGIPVSRSFAVPMKV